MNNGHIVSKERAGRESASKEVVGEEIASKQIASSIWSCKKKAEKMAVMRTTVTDVRRRRRRSTTIINAQCYSLHSFCVLCAF